MDDVSFRPNPRARIDGRKMGAEGNPLLIIDDAFENPEALIELACQASFSRPDHTQYPGINAPLPEAYSRLLLHTLRPLLQSGFGIPTHVPLRFFGFFALATQSPDELKPIQKIPHKDTTDPFKIAMVHYLCKGKQGGTGFFRHTATGFESIDVSRHDTYAEIASQEMAANEGSLNRHTGTNTPGYEMIDFSEAVFNRLVIYRSHCLHAGLLEESSLVSDPATGRLTANSFLEVARVRS